MGGTKQQFPIDAIAFMIDIMQKTWEEKQIAGALLIDI